MIILNENVDDFDAKGRKMDERIIFKKRYLAKYLIYEARISQESLYISKLCTIHFLCKLDPVEQKARIDFKWNDPYGSLTLTFGPSLKCTLKGFGTSVWCVVSKPRQTLKKDYT